MLEQENQPNVTEAMEVGVEGGAETAETSEQAETREKQAAREKIETLSIEINDLEGELTATKQLVEEADLNPFSPTFEVTRKLLKEESSIEKELNEARAELEKLSEMQRFVEQMEQKPLSEIKTEVESAPGEFGELKDQIENYHEGDIVSMEELKQRMHLGTEKVIMARKIIEDRQAEFDNIPLEALTGDDLMELNNRNAEDMTTLQYEIAQGQQYLQEQKRKLEERQLGGLDLKEFKEQIAVNKWKMEQLQANLKEKLGDEKLKTKEGIILGPEGGILGQVAEEAVQESFNEKIDRLVREKNLKDLSQLAIKQEDLLIRLRSELKNEPKPGSYEFDSFKNQLKELGLRSMDEWRQKIQEAIQRREHDVNELYKKVDEVREKLS